MRRLVTLFLLTVLVFNINLCDSPARADVPETELASLLTLFSARALNTGGVRLNWSLERQSPAIVKFRLYRGYEELGNFTVLAEIEAHPSDEVVDYSYTDHSTRLGVSYYYKIAAMSQSSESVFPVVISATPRSAASADNADQSVPLTLLPDENLSLYVRRGGLVHLSIMTEPERSLVNDVLQPGIYEFEKPPDLHEGFTVHMEHEEGYSVNINWPLE